MLVVGFDASDPRLARELADDGRLPAFRSLVAQGASAELPSPWGLFPNATWNTVATGVNAGRHGRYCWGQHVPGTYEVHRMSHTTPHPPFWRALHRAGRRVAVIDVPEAPRPEPGLDGIQVNGWGRHEEHARFATSPPELAGEILQRFGEQPRTPCKVYARDERWAELRDDLVAGIDRKQALCGAYLADEAWDLFMVVFTEGHCIGHQAWAFHDANHPCHDPRLARTVGDPVVDVHLAHDAALGRLLELAGDDTTVVALWPSGVGPNYDATFMFGQIVQRIADRIAPPSPGVRARELARRAWRRTARPLLPRDPDTRGFVSFSNGSRAFYRAPNNEAYGAIRVNLRGREPAGVIEPGPELDALYSRIERELSTWTNFDTGTPLFRSVERVDRHYSGPELDRLPDLIVEFSRDAIVRRAGSPDYGIVEDEYGGTRSGDHYPGGLLVVRGPGIEAGTAVDPVRLVDLAPTISAALGTELDGVEGLVRRDLLGATRMPHR